jgi:hypothetical protein
MGSIDRNLVDIIAVFVVSQVMTFEMFEISALYQELGPDLDRLDLKNQEILEKFHRLCKLFNVNDCNQLRSLFNRTDMQKTLAMLVRLRIGGNKKQMQKRYLTLCKLMPRV